MSEPDTCEWRGEDYDSDEWVTSCKKSFCLMEGTPAENDMRFCCYCGKPLVTVPFAFDDDDEEADHAR